MNRILVEYDWNMNRTTSKNWSLGVVTQTVHRNLFRNAELFGSMVNWHSGGPPPSPTPPLAGAPGRMEGGWKADGGRMEGGWRRDGGRMEGGWRADGGMEGGWRADGGRMEADGGRMEGGWRADGGWRVDGQK